MASPPYLLDLDSLCCHEDHLWVEAPVEDHGEGMPVHLSSPVLIGGGEEGHHVHQGHLSLYQLLFFWDDEELRWLSAKEKEQHSPRYPEEKEDGETFASWARKEAVGWVVRASTRLGFTAQTTLLAVDYLDRFLSRGQCGQRERQPWMAQLTAVACLSLAAKVEETHVPLLLDLQVEETRFVFEARTIQRMELLVLSTLGWRMTPVTPLSYIDHIVRRMTTNSEKNAINPLANAAHRHPHLQWEFERRCHSILLSLVADPRWLQFLPSVMAAAAMLHSLFQLDLLCSGQSSLDLENKILALLNASKEDVEVCYHFILESIATGDNSMESVARRKRKYPFCTSPSSPKGVIDSAFSYDSSNDSWAVASTASAAPSVSSSPEHPLFKRPNTGIVTMSDDEGPLSPFHRVFV